MEHGDRDASSDRPPLSGRAKALIALLLVHLVVTSAFVLATVGDLTLLQRVRQARGASGLPAADLLFARVSPGRAKDQAPPSPLSMIDG